MGPGIKNLGLNGKFDFLIINKEADSLAVEEERNVNWVVLMEWYRFDTTSFSLMGTSSTSKYLQ